MTPDEARSLGRAIRAARLERGLSQLKLAVAIGSNGGQVSVWERGQVPAGRGRVAPASSLSREQLTAIADALNCTVESIADRAALSATTRVLYGLEPLGPARTVVGGRQFDLTDAEADRVADFITGLIAARDLQ
ncbi:helix-turn-helix transcriptional regulator [Dietzia sp. ANT_WB102]|uniref:helix-turn-helix transcriptional regulator n=1 Tax=Dietzia sp. ANT_WB102 TaxID=2597345 RepID=UPI0011EDC8E1|nr:helix-turn-helix transcriptional regulator [Dietzia sp. ANT_WB102]KAA0919132.1 helix-turn-helix transcriptional regulator [Dietzia sp. ANT_WB102]